MLNFFRIPAFVLPDGNLFVGSTYTPLPVFVPVYSQIYFLVFFPTVAVISRIDLKMRAKFLLVGFLCFLALILTQFLFIGGGLLLGISNFGGLVFGISNYSNVIYSVTTIFVTILIASLFIELAEFSVMTNPPRTKIKPIIKRDYTKEFVYLAIQMTGSISLVYFLLGVFQLLAYSPFAIFALVHFNIIAMKYFTYFVSYFIYAAKMPNWFKWVRSSNASKTESPPPVSFLIPAYNEEKIIRRCIESIDRAAGKYDGKTEIIIVNDGSKDRTAEIIADVIQKLKYSSAKLITTPNYGKALALRSGLDQVSGEFIFRIDADSVMDENALGPLMNHFRNPEVGSVSGLIWPLEERTVWQKATTLANILFFLAIRRGEELVDSILVQSGAYSVFRKDALMKVGGWRRDVFGEDGELTNRMGRYGYRQEFEPNSIVYSDIPEKLTALLTQRARWDIGYYQTYGMNLDLVLNPKEYKNPRSIVFLMGIIWHGLSLGWSTFIAFLAASILTGTLNFFINSGQYNVPSYFYYYYVGIASILLINTGVWIYSLSKANRPIAGVLYFPFLQALIILHRITIRPHVMEVVLSWSRDHKEYTYGSFLALRENVKRIFHENV